MDAKITLPPRELRTTSLVCLCLTRLSPIVHDARTTVGRNMNRRPHWVKELSVVWVEMNWGSLRYVEWRRGVSNWRPCIQSLAHALKSHIEYSGIGSLAMMLYPSRRMTVSMSAKAVAKRDEGFWHLKIALESLKPFQVV